MHHACAISHATAQAATVAMMLARAMVSGVMFIILLLHLVIIQGFSLLTIVVFILIIGSLANIVFIITTGSLHIPEFIA